MYPRLVHLHGPIWIYSYGTMIALGFLLFLFCMYRHPLRKKLMTADQYFNVLFVGFIAAITGGRLLFVLSNLNEFSGKWIEIFFPWEGGFTLLGGIIGVLIAAPLYLYSIKVPILQVLDIASLYAPLMQSIARLGCLLAGCCYGAIAWNTYWWNSIIFTNSHGFAPCQIPLYPTQIYMSLASLLIFCIMLMLERVIGSKRGLLICSYLFLESFARFMVDFWRGDQEQFYYFSLWSNHKFALSQLQIFSLTLCALALLSFFLITRCNFNQET